MGTVLCTDGKAVCSTLCTDAKAVFEQRALVLEFASVVSSDMDCESAINCPWLKNDGWTKRMVDSACLVGHGPNSIHEMAQDGSDGYETGIQIALLANVDTDPWYLGSPG